MYIIMNHINEILFFLYSANRCSILFHALSHLRPQRTICRILRNFPFSYLGGYETQAFQSAGSS